MTIRTVRQSRRAHSSSRRTLASAPHLAHSPRRGTAARQLLPTPSCGQAPQSVEPSWVERQEPTSRRMADTTGLSASLPFLRVHSDSPPSHAPLPRLSPSQSAPAPHPAHPHNRKACSVVRRLRRTCSLLLVPSPERRRNTC